MAQRVVESTASKYLHNGRGFGEYKLKTESFCYLLVRRRPTQQTADKEAATAAREQATWRAAAQKQGVRRHGGGGAYSKHDPLAQRGSESWSRILRPPRKRGGHVMIDMCMPDGKASSLMATRRRTDRWHYRLARKARLGDAWPAHEVDLELNRRSGNTGLILDEWEVAARRRAAEEAEAKAMWDAEQQRLAEADEVVEEYYEDAEWEDGTWEDGREARPSWSERRRQSPAGGAEQLKEE